MLDQYEQVDSVPEGLKWKPSRGTSKRVVTLYSLGNVYKLQRVLATGEVSYVKLKDADDKMSPKEQIDTEPEEKKDQRFREGSHCWFVSDAGRWFCCLVEARTGHSIVLRPTTGWDAERLAPWPFGETLEIPSKSQAFKRLRKLKDRQI